MKKKFHKKIDQETILTMNQLRFLNKENKPNLQTTKNLIQNNNSYNFSQWKMKNRCCRFQMSKGSKQMYSKERKKYC